ncbi:TetR/AcrR family transcriptional regulator [Lysobacter korlensis]|uniref:TetR/AcrR family transcriptional regulator n=1 Tax=Lysobacter korlensis TaxID=553636 RepID=A0ABV6RS09_9GAMM
MPNTPADRRSRKREQTASHLSATAFRLFEFYGYAAVSMEQIADEADVAKATLYNYFPVKEALLAHRFREDIRAGMAEREAVLDAYQSFEARMRYLLSESAAWHAARKPYLPHYLRFLTSQACYGDEPAGECTSSSDSRQILTLMFDAAQQSGEIDTRQPAAQIAWSFEYLLFAAIAAWLTDPSTDLTKRFLDAFDLTMQGIAARPNTTSSRSCAKGTK